MGQEDNSKVRQFLGDPAAYQFAHKPFATIMWPGRSTTAITKPNTDLENWFLKREISPVFTAEHINVTQNRISSQGWDTWDEFWYQMNSYSSAQIAADLESLLAHNIIDTNHIVTENTVQSTSAAAFTLTGAANTNEKVVVVSCKNSTRAHTWTLDYTPSGGTAAQLRDDAAGAATAGQTTHPIGSGNDARSIIGPIWIQPSDTMVSTNINFVAADVMEIAYTTEVYSM